jgi:putative transposase
MKQVHGRVDHRGFAREHKAGARAADLARKHAISEATLYNWKARFGGTNDQD